MIGVQIGEKHTYRDWRLGWTDYSIDYPDAKTYLVEVPGSDGILDFTEALTGRVRYGVRKISFTFEALDEDYFKYETLKRDIADYLHGRKHNVTLDTDPNYYYYARLSVDFSKVNKYGSVLVITGIADPYKYEQFSSGDEWLWDPFSFDTGNIRTANELLVDGEREVRLLPTKIPVIPKFICTAPMTVTFEGHIVSLPEGEFESPYIELGDNENVLFFQGNGMVSILYRGGVL